MLPGLQPDAKRILTNIEILNLNDVPKSLAILGAGAVGVEFASCFHRFGSKVSVFEMLPRIVPVEDEEVSKELERYFKKSGIRVETGAKVEQRPDHRYRRALHRDSGQRQRRNGRSRSAAGRHRPQAQHRKHRPRRHPRRTRPRLHQGGPVPAHRRTGRLRHRRYRRRHAAAGARGDGRRHGRDRAHRRQTGDSDQQEPHSRRDLYRAGHRQRGPHRSAGARRGLRRQESASFPSRRTARPASWASTTGSSRSSPTTSTAKSWASTSSGRKRSS